MAKRLSPSALFGRENGAESSLEKDVKKERTDLDERSVFIAVFDGGDFSRTNDGTIGVGFCFFPLIGKKFFGFIY